VCAGISYLVRAEQGPAELPGLRGDLSLHQPLLGQVLILYVRVIVQLVECLGGRERKKEGSGREKVSIIAV
jgi:hypothetical protein